ncbi:MAG TPA: protein translocase subunit SecF [Pyrinomonadaceae bacterium]|jgi:preprotein translocase subunit SecF|nr:protein translocase subunit SecF [Pyrinomonadaceae bacterium]
MIQLFKNINYDWLGRRRVFLIVSVLLLLAGLGSAMVRQFVPGGTEAFNLGVDFKPGTVVTIKFPQPPTVDAVREALGREGLNEAVIQPVVGKGDEVIVKIPRTATTDANTSPDGQSQVDPSRAALGKAVAAFPGATIIKTDAVDPVAGRQLRTQAITVTLLALIGVLLYIAFRFEWTYGAAAVITVFHDVLVTLGFFSIFQWEVDLTVVAALLTLVGFSVNDTIVTFDRVRENLRLRRRDTLYNITNEAINQTFSRTIITGGLVFLSVLAMVLFGGEVLRGFSLALFIGIITGTYSTIAIASPIMVWWQQRLDAGRINAPSTKGGTPAGSAARASKAKAAAL